MSPRLLRALCAAALSIASLPALADSLALGCERADPRDRKVEAARLRELAGGRVTRKSAHVLLVDVGGRELRFEDEPPYDEALEGVRHGFCDRRGGFILVQSAGSRTANSRRGRAACPTSTRPGRSR